VRFSFGYSSIVQIDLISAENEINGSVLLKLDADTLKSEIDISVYGTRVGIEEAIDAIRPTSECKWLIAANATDLFHPPSFTSHNVAPLCRHCLLASFANLSFPPPSLLFRYDSRTKAW